MTQKSIGCGKGGAHLSGKLSKGDANRSTQKMFLGWEIDTTWKFLTLPQAWKENMLEAHAGIPPKVDRVTKKYWFHLLRTLRITVSEISGTEGISRRL